MCTFVELSEKQVSPWHSPVLKPWLAAHCHLDKKPAIPFCIAEQTLCHLTPSWLPSLIAPSFSQAWPLCQQGVPGVFCTSHASLTLLTLFQPASVFVGFFFTLPTSPTLTWLIYSFFVETPVTFPGRVLSWSSRWIFLSLDFPHCFPSSLLCLPVDSTVLWLKSIHFSVPSLPGQGPRERLFLSQCDMVSWMNECLDLSFFCCKCIKLISVE